MISRAQASLTARGVTSHNARRVAAASSSDARAFHAKPTASQALPTALPALPSDSAHQSIPHLSREWSRTPKLSQDSRDDVVPAYYLGRKESNGGLMTQLAASILNDGIVAQTRVKREKVPIEVKESDGVIRYPSGFEPPTPASGFHPVVTRSALRGKAMNRAEGVQSLASVRVSWDEALRPAVKEVNGLALGTMRQRNQGKRGNPRLVASSRALELAPLSGGLV